MYFPLKIKNALLNTTAYQVDIRTRVAKPPNMFTRTRYAYKKQYSNLARYLDAKYVHAYLDEGGGNSESTMAEKRTPKWKRKRRFTSDAKIRTLANPSEDEFKNAFTQRMTPPIAKRPTYAGSGRESPQYVTRSPRKSSRLDKTAKWPNRLLPAKPEVLFN